MPKKQIGKKIDVNGNQEDLGYTLNDEEVAKIKEIDSKVDKTTKINNKALNTDIILNATDVGAVSTSSNLIIKTITSSSVRITSYDVGVYKLTYSGEKTIYYSGTTSSTNTKLPTGDIILVINKSSSGYWNWYCISSSSSYPMIYYGFTTSSNGSYGSKSLSSLLTTVTYPYLNDSRMTSSSKMYAPTTAGTSGQILSSTGSAPKWIDANYATQDDIPTVNNGTLTIQQDGTTLGTFTANQSGNTTVNIESGSAGGGQTIYDLVIRTQEEFETFYSELDAGTMSSKTVLIVGDGGNLEFKREDGKGLQLPETLKIIDGINTAKITINNFLYSAENHSALFYSAIPSGDGFRINNIVLNINSSAGSITGIRYSKNIYNTSVYINSTYYASNAGNSAFRNCNNLISCYANINCETGAYAFRNCDYVINCSAVSTSLSGTGYACYQCNQINNCSFICEASDNCIGISECKYITNCTFTGKSSSDTVDGYKKCYYLANCISTVTGKLEGMAFYACKDLSNCEGTGENTGSVSNGYGFYQCERLSNCVGTGKDTGGTRWGYGFHTCYQLSNCTGLGTSSGKGGHAFSGCKYCNGCRSGGANTTSIWTGTNSFRDDDSCDLD